MKTNSRAQDALRAGFQVTCSKGIAELFKLKDITKKSCEEYKQLHLQNVKEAIEHLPQKIADKFADGFSCYIDSSWLSSWHKLFLSHKVNRQKPRKFTVKITNVHEPKLDLNNGTWTTNINLSITKHKWSGWYEGEYTTFKEETFTKIHTITTDAKVAKLEFTDYDIYAGKYIPDEAIEVVQEALKIGLTDIKVVEPKVVGAHTDYDPIIVGFIEDTMYLLVWFGYDKSRPMACNM